MTPLIVGLTGQTGAGKSTASAYFRREGFAVIDCDQVAREVTRASGECLPHLVREFSDSILAPDGELNRKALGSMVFQDKQKLLRLNEIIFPFITSDIREKIRELEVSGAEVIFLDAPTLFESGADQMCGLILSVTGKDEVRKRRIMARDGLTEEAARNRMNSQLDEAFFRSHSDFVIENNGSPEELETQLASARAFLIHFISQKHSGGPASSAADA